MHRVRAFLSAILICVISLSLCACNDVGGNNNGNDNKNQDLPQETTYTIQYSDTDGIHTITVKSGQLYSVDSTPNKVGYEFLGYYDAKVGGTQYIDESGSSVSPFTDNKNIVLYPQFKAKEYTLVLDYQGAAVTGSRSIRVAYDSEISELPLNIELEHKTFVGWYTQPNRQGKQISDKYGVMPETQKVTEKVFDLTDEDGFIKLYAGFLTKQYTVTFYSEDNGVPEEIQVDYDTPIKDVQPQKRVNGMAVLSWSKKRNDINGDELFNGKVTSDMILYAAERAPIIDFETNGGNAVNSIVARVGESIVLPTPKKDNYKFIGWSDLSGNSVNYSTMPESSTKLSAKWQAMIILDSNGGTEVSDISEPQGTNIELPTVERDGYLFAGWYDKNNEKYTATAMPAESVLLIARYVKFKKDTITVIAASSVKDNWATTPNFSRDSHYDQVDLEQIFDKGVTKITVTAYYRSQYTFTTFSMGTQYTYMNWYSEKNASSGNLLWSYSDTHEEKNKYVTYTQKKEMTLSTPYIYICYYTSNSDGHGKWTDFYIEIEYLDTSTLY